MALLKVTYKSETLQRATGINVILPEKRIKDAPLPVLYLLHGLSGNQDAWCSQTSIERYVRYKNLAVVMPDAFNSFYTDMPKGVYNCYTYIMSELIPFVRESFGVSSAREDNYIAGLSMGGYGAFKIALSNPDTFCAAASFSGSLDIASRAREHDLSMVFEVPPDNTENDLFYLAKTVMPQKPRLYQWCGTEDFLYDDNIRFRDFMKSLDFDYTYKESSGDHQWKYWDDQIRKIFGWFGLKNNI